VLHHVVDPAAFLARQAALLRPGGVLVLCDHATDPDPARADEHNQIERLRDTTHTINHTSGAIADLFAGAGLIDVRALEERFTLDFDEWYDRGTPASPKAAVRERLIAGPHARGFRPAVLEDGAVRIDCVRVLVRGVKAS
jgi:SAM-dependent methyltransferase